MEAVREDEFLSWAAGVGVGFDERYPDSGCLSLLPPRDYARFWTLAGDPGTWPYFIDSFLAGLDEWETAYPWPRFGSWPTAAQSGSTAEKVRDVVLRGAGVAAGWQGAVRFDADEADRITAVLFIGLTVGWQVNDDLFFIPDHGRQIVQTDHHDVIHVECASEDRIQRLVAHMADSGYELPTKPPDWTFKWPAWMGPEPAR